VKHLREDSIIRANFLVDPPAVCIDLVHSRREAIENEYAEKNM